MLARYGHLEAIPEDWRTWGVNAANPAALPLTLARERDRAFLFRDLATLRTDIPVFDDVDELRWAVRPPPSRPRGPDRSRATGGTGKTGTPGTWMFVARSPEPMNKARGGLRGASRPRATNTQIQLVL